MGKKIDSKLAGIKACGEISAREVSSLLARQAIAEAHWPMLALEKLVSKGVEVVGHHLCFLLMLGTVLATTFWCGANPQDSAAAHSDK